MEFAEFLCLLEVLGRSVSLAGSLSCDTFQGQTLHWNTLPGNYRVIWMEVNASWDFGW